MKPTIHHVAKEANCSITTVSLVLNNKPCNISAKKREAIYSAVKKLGYQPNKLAASLVTKKTFTLGLVIPDNINFFFGRLSKEVEQKASQYGYSVIYGNSNNDISRDCYYLQTFTKCCVDGILLVRSANSNDKAETDKDLRTVIDSLPMPLIAVDRTIDGADIPACVVDHVQGGYLATRHLLEYGHSTIACITGPLYLSSSKDRLEGYRLALKEFGIPYRESLVFEGAYQLGVEEDVLAKFMSQGATAIFSQNDLMAYGVYRQAALHHVAIPEELSIVGFDNLEMDAILTPQLTSVEQPVSDIAQAAVNALMQRIDDNNAPIPQLQQFSPYLVQRGSVCKRKS